eukprot:gene5499-1937_t
MSTSFPASTSGSSDSTTTPGTHSTRANAHTHSHLSIPPRVVEHRERESTSITRRLRREHQVFHWGEGNEKWFQGPAWLRLPEHTWPPSPEKFEPGKDALIETKPNCEFTLLTKLETNGNLSTVIDVRNFSNYNKLLRVTALVMRFIDNLKAKVRGSEVIVNGSNDYEGIITVGDVDNTRKLWILEIQRYITSDKRYGDWEKNLDIVTIREDHIPRSQWRLGKVTKLICGKDEHIRGARLKVISKQGKISEIERPLQALFPLELCDKNRVPDVDISNSSPTGGEQWKAGQSRPIEPGRPVRPRRQAALNADTIRRILDSK